MGCAHIKLITLNFAMCMLGGHSFLIQRFVEFRHCAKCWVLAGNKLDMASTLTELYLTERPQIHNHTVNYTKAIMISSVQSIGFCESV